MTDVTILPEGEAAVITTDGMTNLSILLPKRPDDEEVPELVIYLVIMASRWGDDEFVREQIEWFEQQKKMAS